MEEKFNYTIDHLVNGATISHLHVQNRNINEIKKLPICSLLSKDVDGETALHYAATNNDLEICKVLIEKCPQLVNIRDNDSLTAFDWAKLYNEEYNSHIEVCTYFENISK